MILEGVTCTRLAATDRLAYRVWVEAAEDLRLQRGLERDGSSHRQHWLTWMDETELVTLAPTHPVRTSGGPASRSRTRR